MSRVGSKLLFRMWGLCGGNIPSNTKSNENNEKKQSYRGKTVVGTVESPGAWPSWIDARRQYIVVIRIVHSSNSKSCPRETVAHLTRRQVGANPIPIPHPTNLALFGHTITLHRFNQGAHTIAGAQIGAGGWPPLASPHFNHGKLSHSMDLLTPSSSGVLHPLVFDYYWLLITSGEGCQASPEQSNTSNLKMVKLSVFTLFDEW